jgi:hypothetical protein
MLVLSWVAGMQIVVVVLCLLLYKLPCLAWFQPA